MLRAPSLRRSYALGVQRKLRPIEKCQFAVLPQFQDANGGLINMGSGGSDLDAQSGSAAGADTNDPTYVGERGLRLPGVDGNHASTPDSAALSITGDIDIRVRVSMDDWTPAATATFVSKYSTTGNQRGYIFRLSDVGILQMWWSTNGTDLETEVATVATGFTNGTAHWVRATLDVDNGSSDAEIKFYTADDSPDEPSTWTQLGDTVLHGATTSQVDNTTPVWIGDLDTSGTGLFPGLIQRVSIRDGIDGTVVFDADFTKLDGGTTSFAHDHTSDGLRLWSNANSYASIPDGSEVSITGDIDLIAYLEMDDWTPSTQTGIIRKWGDGYALYMATSGTIQLWTATAGGSNFVGSSLTIPTLTGSQWIRATRAATSGFHNFYVSSDPRSTDPDEITWTLVGDANRTSTHTGNIVDGAGDLYFGNESGADSDITLHRAIVRDGIGGTIAADVDFTRNPYGATSFTEDSSNGFTVTVNGPITTINQSGVNPARIIDGPTHILHTDDYFETANETKWTNLWDDEPSFGTSVGSWSMRSGSAGTNTLSSTESFIGPNSMYVDHTDSVEAFGGVSIGEGDANDIPIDASTQYTLSCWVKRTESTVPLYLLARDQDGNAISATSAIPTTTDWQRITLTFTSGVGDTGLQVRFTRLNDTTPVAYYLDAFQVETGATANPYVDGSLPLGRWTGTAHASTSESRAVMDPLIDSSFVAAFAGRTYDPDGNEHWFGKRDGYGVDAGWGMRNLSGFDTAQGLIGDGAATGADASATMTAGGNLVLGMRRDVAADEVEAFLNGTGSGSPATDNTTASIANDLPLRIGADSGATPALYADVEHHGAAFRNCHDGPALSDREVEVLSRQLGAATGRFY